MSAGKVNSLDYKSLSPDSKKHGAEENASLKPRSSIKKETEIPQTLENPYKAVEKKQVASDSQPSPNEIPLKQNSAPLIKETPQEPLSYSESLSVKKREKAVEKDKKLLSGDRWLARNGHTLTYIGIFLFTLVVYFRPYELIPALSGLSSIALVIAVATILIYLPTQFSTEGTLTTFSTEVKCILFMALWAILTIPLAKDPSLAWATFNDSFSKVVLIFIVMVNTLRSKARVKGLMWLAIGVGVMLSYQAIQLYREGIFKTEGYRVQVDFGGMFGNPNDMAIHLVIFTPIAIALGIASKNIFSKLVYFAFAGLMVAGNMVTQSRGGFLGLIAVAVVMVWKLSKKQRFQVVLISAVVGAVGILLAPGNYGLRILSIFIPSLDPVGSSNERKDLLLQSIIVTLRNPWGIGIGNFPVVGARNLQTHNAYTQVSSELGMLALVAYVILMVSPIRKLAAIERQMFLAGDYSWLYYLSIGVQASIIGYMVSSFFGPVAYNWYVYYVIAYAVCLRRIYQLSQAEKEADDYDPIEGLKNYFKLQKA